MSADTAMSVSPEHLQSSLTQAADLIRDIDTAYSEMSSFAAHAARDAEEARKNARVASEVLRFYSGGAALTSSSAAGSSNNSTTGSSTRTGTGNTAPPVSSLTFRAAAAASPRLYLPPRSFQASSPRATSSYYRSQILSSTSAASPPRSAFRSSPRHHQRTPIVDVVNDSASLASSSTIPSTTRRAGTSGTPSSERLAAAHAEDVLQLSLELERTKLAWQHEQVAHEDTRTALERAEQTNTQLQGQLETLHSQQETQQQEYGVTIDTLQDDLNRAQQRANAAEEDAQLALELAKGNSDSRAQMEAWLERAMQEIDLLRLHIQNEGSVPPPEVRTTRTVRFADQPTVWNEQQHENENERNRKEDITDHGYSNEMDLMQESPDSNTTSSAHAISTPRSVDSLAAVGRQLLQQKLGLGSSGSSSSPLYSDVVPRTPPSDSSAERRRRLRNRLATPHVPLSTNVSSSSTSPAAPTSPSRNFGVAVQALDVCRNTCAILKESGKRLQLGGRRWENNSENMGSNAADEIHLESLARHYCMSVESLLESKQKEIAELDSLCSIWESGTPATATAGCS